MPRESSLSDSGCNSFWRDGSIQINKFSRKLSGWRLLQIYMWYGYTHIYIYTYLFRYSLTPAFGAISLGLRGSGTFGVPVGVPAAPIWETAAFGGGERNVSKQKNWDARGRPGWGVSLAYAAFGGDKKKIVILVAILFLNIS